MSYLQWSPTVEITILLQYKNCLQEYDMPIKLKTTVHPKCSKEAKNMVSLKCISCSVKLVLHITTVYLKAIFNLLSAFPISGGGCNKLRQYIFEYVIYC